MQINFSKVSQWYFAQTFNQSFTMKKLTQYQSTKSLLTDYAKEIKGQFPNDKPLCRQEINLFCESLEKDLDRNFDKIRLQNVACKLHPKD